MSQPSRKVIRTFLKVIEKLDRYEATERHIRGYGAGIPGPLPVPEVVEVLAWLKELANPNQRQIDRESR
jgi:hypothetical protein